jgi:TRAP-type C4-dicarboxylate transport system substrate-binding protein
VNSFRINELADSHTEIGLYSLSFMVTMNKSVYNSMPDDLKQVIDKHSGLELAKQSGKIFDQVDELGRAEAVELGHTMITIEGGAENPAWKPVLDATTENYLQDLEDKGMPARNVYKRALELSEQCL